MAEMLGMNEVLVWEGRPSQVVNLNTFIMALGVLGVLGFVYYLVWTGYLTIPARDWPLHGTISFYDFARLGLVLLALVVILICAYRYLRIRCMSYTLSTQRLLFSFGIFSRVRNEVELYRIRDFTLHQPFWLRVMNLGTVILLTTDRTDQIIWLAAISKPQEVCERIRKHVEACRIQRGVVEMGYY